jgi:response regulator RpfG family c-di-GMP phosphodiesterase
MDEAEITILEKAAALHDIGKIGIRDCVLQKEGKLTPEEYKHIQEHVEITHHILEKVHMSSDFVKITEIACSHHEKYDGSGYYRHLKGDEIPFGGRIRAVSDVFDAITSKRHYRDKMSIEKVIDIIKTGAGSHFDPDVVEKFLHIPLNKIVDVFLTENHLTLTPSDAKTLEKYNFTDLYKAITCGKLKSLITAFNKYYVGADCNAQK